MYTSSTSCIADTGSTGHFITIAAPSFNQRPANPSIAVLLPDGSTIYSTHTAYLNIPRLPPAACQAHVFPTLASGSLISISTLCDHGCVATFTSDTVEITLDQHTILSGTRAASTGLWNLHLPTPPPSDTDNNANFPRHDNDNQPTTHAANSVISQQTLADRIAFYHAALFSPSLSTWCTAIDNNHLATWPELTSAQIRKHPPTSAAMVKGHLDQTRANQRSTKKPTVTFTADTATPAPRATINTATADTSYCMEARLA